MPKYYLGIIDLEHRPHIEITESEFHSLEESKKILSRAYEFEARYENIVRSYEEIEKFVLLKTMERGFGSTTVSEDASYIREINRLSLSYMASVTLHEDGLLRKRMYDSFASEDVISSKTKELRKKEYDSCFEYRFIAKLRDNAQHYSLPIDCINHGSAFDEKDTINFFLNLSVSKERLKRDSSINRTLLGEMPDRVNILEAIRVHVRCWARIQEEVRKSLTESISVSRNIIQVAQSRYKEVYRTVLGLEAMQFDGSEKSGSIALVLNWDDVRSELVVKNKYPLPNSTSFNFKT